MTDYKQAAALARSETALLRRKVDPDFLAAKMETASMRDAAASIDPADAAAVEALAARLFAEIPGRFLRVRPPREEVPPMSAADRTRIIAEVKKTYAHTVDPAASQKLLEGIGVLQKKRGA